MTKKIIIISLLSAGLIALGIHYVSKDKKMRMGSKEANQALEGMKMY